MIPFTPDWFLALFLLVLPAYVTNASAVYFNPELRGKQKTPTDFGIKFIDGRPLFGGKSLEGAVASILFGTFVAMLVGWMGFLPLGLTFDEWVTVAFFSTIGMHVGDRLGSFVKRRMNLSGGEPFEYFDQMGFIVMALAFETIADPRVGYSIGAEGFVTILLATYFVHRAFSLLGFKMGIKKVPW